MIHRNEIRTVSNDAGSGKMCAESAGAGAARITRRWFDAWSRLRAGREWLQRHEETLWWLHSAYALLLGIAVMWLGAKRFSFLRVVIFYIAFIWLSALCLPLVARYPRLSAAWQRRIRAIVLYFSKNFYQQLLFFLLPVYYLSSTFLSANFFFVLALAISAILSTMDIFYDRYIAAKWPLTVIFLTFNLFACINVMLPVLWGISNSLALWISAGLTFICFASLINRLAGWHGHHFYYALVSAAVLLVVIALYLPPLIPPAPLRLVNAGFGKSIQSLELIAPLNEVPAGWVGRITAMTAIKAPNGLKEKVRHLWYVDGRLVYSQEPREIIGGRSKGFRIWSHITWGKNLTGRRVTCNVETEGGQLIGRAHLSVAQ